jgi:hypothetical protein
MASFKLHSNLPIGTPAPWIIKPDHFNSIPDEPGIYVVGVKIPVLGQGEKICLLNVGIMKDIRIKIKGHWDDNNNFTATGELNSFKEIFDLISKDISSIYLEMEKYNLSVRKKKTLNSFYKNIANDYPSLIWFNDNTFFDYILNLPAGKSTYKPGSGHKGSVKPNGDLDIINTPQSIALKHQIENVKQLYTDRFFYTYITLDSVIAEILNDKNHTLFNEAVSYNKTKCYNIGRNYGPGKTICACVENTLKSRLSTIGIHTSAKSTNKMLPITDTFDLSFIQNDLVNLTGKPFINPLIL